MKTLNRVQLVGYVGNDPVIRQCNNGNYVASFPVATHLRLKNTQLKTTWHEIKIFGEEKIKTISNHLIKGSHVLIEGSLEYNDYFNEQGLKMQSAEINAFYYMNLDR